MALRDCVIALRGRAILQRDSSIAKEDRTNAQGDRVTALGGRARLQRDRVIAQGDRANA